VFVGLCNTLVVSKSRQDGVAYDKCLTMQTMKTFMEFENTLLTQSAQFENWYNILLLYVATLWHSSRATKRVSALFPAASSWQCGIKFSAGK